MDDVNQRLEPTDYNDLGSMNADRSVVVLDNDRHQGIVELSFSWDDLNYHLSLSEEYSDSAHLDALGYLEENYDNEDLPEDIGTDDLRNVSSASSSPKVNVNWKDEIRPGHPASGLDY